MNKKSKMIVAADFFIAVVLLVGIALAVFGLIQRDGTIADLIMLVGILAFGPSNARSIIHWLSPRSTALVGWDWDRRSERLNSGVMRAARRIRHAHKRTFKGLSQRGAIGRDLAKATKPMTCRAGRQHGGGGTAAKQAASSKSSDDDGDGGEPPRLPQLYIYLPLLFTYIAFALLIGCSAKTLRNRVSAGTFPAPIKTQFGPRFTQEHLAIALAPQPQADPPPPTPPKKRGRPRIALALASKGGAK